MRDWHTSEQATNSAAAFAIDDVRDQLERLQSTVERVVRGKREAIKMALVALVARGHLLIEDVPGIGKTTLGNALAKSLSLSFRRVQFTSDLLPSDITGLAVFNQRTGEFEWNAGPIFANIVLADEINRSTPKAQSALLEAMAEEQVTVDGVTRQLPSPFMVIATQNPAEHHGTYPLPESQLDRFMLRIEIGYPASEDERTMLRDRELGDPLTMIQPVMLHDDLVNIQTLASEVRVDDSLVDYLLQIAAETRSSELIELGVSPRGTLSLFRAAQALALIEGRDYCIADDIKRLVVPCFAHRIALRRTLSTFKRNSTAEVLSEILTNVAVPI
ncbi:MAG: MoxR family ATPase [Blastocatellia bacterium]|nr:MoxR family ATPase [Blastocatellia bacterium]